jgi:hypothetical protein
MRSPRRREVVSYDTKFALARAVAPTFALSSASDEEVGGPLRAMREQVPKREGRVGR